MSYPTKLLNDHETVALDMHPHWWHFAKPAAALLGSVILGIVSLIWLDGDAGTAVGWIAIVLIIGSALWLLSRYAQYMTTNFVITSDRIIYRSGVFAKTGIEIPLERVNNVLFNQSIFERLLGAGDLMIESGGMEGQQRFSDIKHPDEVQRAIHGQIEASKVRGSGRGGTGASDVASQLEKLEGMLERGTLSPEEFAREKRRLLGD